MNRAPNLAQRYGNRTHGRDILTGHASAGRHSVSAIIQKVTDWFTREPRTPWRQAASGAWRAISGGGWRGEAPETGWRSPASGGFREEC